MTFALLCGQPNREVTTRGIVRHMGSRVILLLAISLFASSYAQVEDPRDLTSNLGQTYTSADVQRALEDAERFTREGKYQQALERHIWYHRNALKYAPSEYGVRLSFALSDWAKLGKVYPKALGALRSARDEALATYRKDPSDSLMLGEVMSIDFALNDLRSAKALFYEGRKHGVRDSLMLQLDRIVAAGELKWAGDVIGDPTKRLEEIRSEREQSMSALKDRQDLAKGVNEMFAAEIANLVKAVAKVNGLPNRPRRAKEGASILGFAHYSQRYKERIELSHMECSFGRPCVKWRLCAGVSTGPELPRTLGSLYTYPPAQNRANPRQQSILGVSPSHLDRDLIAGVRIGMGELVVGKPHATGRGGVSTRHGGVAGYPRHGVCAESR